MFKHLTTNPLPPKNSKCIQNTPSKINTSNAIAPRLDQLILELESSAECQHAYNKLNCYFEELKKLLPHRKRHLVTQVDDCIVEILLLHEEFFYMEGYEDGLKPRKKLNKLPVFLSHIFKEEVNL